MTAADVQDWVRRSSASRTAHAVHAIHARGPRLTEDGSSWVSFSSPTGTGRLIRAADGSSRGYVRRHRDGVRVVDHRGETTTVAHLELIVAALSTPAPGGS